MGAKTPEQINKVRPSVKCDACGRKFLNASALKSHFKFLHVLKTDGPKRARKKPLRKKVVPVHMLKRVNPSPESTQENRSEATEKSQEFAGKQTTVSKKPEFECPVCEEKFPVYFTAFRHIQKNHCVDEKGEKVLPNSPQLVKPVRIEVCASCRKEIRSTEQHNCPKHQTNRDQYLCLGCEQVFSGLVLFQHHVKGFHADGAQNYFFPTQDVFTSWKADLQEQAIIELIRLNKQKTKEVYHCSHHHASDTAITKLCPSTITVREYPKGIHVCYYKEHHGHTVENVQLNKYNQYCISLYTREAEDLQIEDADDNDLYLQFKKMVTCIAFDAAKVDVTTLKELLGKALEMTTVLKHYKSEDRNTPLISKCLTDAQISRTLDSLKPIQRKHKISLIGKNTKKVEAKKVKQTPSIEKMISCSIENGITSRLRSSPAVNRKSPVLVKAVSFSKSVPKITVETPQKSSQKLIIEEPLQKSTQKSKIEEPPQKRTQKSIIEEPPQKRTQKTIIEEPPQKSTQKSKIEEPPQKRTQKSIIEEPPQKRTRSIIEGPPQTTQKSIIEEPPQTTTQKSIIEEPPQKTLPKTVDVESESKKQEASAPPTPVPRSMLQSPSSFNDSYKHFVDQNFKCITNINTSTPRTKTYSKKKEVFKTKIGQFNMKSAVTSPKDSSPTSPKVTKDLREIKVIRRVKARELKGRELQELREVTELKEVKGREVKVLREVKGKDVKELREVPVIPKTWKAKEMVYEVKEQENDCNILILKI